MYRGPKKSTPALVKRTAADTRSVDIVCISLRDTLYPVVLSYQTKCVSTTGMQRGFMMHLNQQVCIYVLCW